MHARVVFSYNVVCYATTETISSVLHSELGMHAHTCVRARAHAQKHACRLVCAYARVRYTHTRPCARRHTRSHACTHTHMHEHTQACRHVFMYSRRHTDRHARTHAGKHVDRQACRHTSMQACIPASMHACSQAPSLDTRMQARTHARRPTCRQGTHAAGRQVR